MNAPQPLSHASDLLTNSAVKTYRACPRLYQLRYVEGFRPAREASVLWFGDLIHKGLEQWWLNEGEDRLPAALEAIGRDAAKADPFEHAKAVAMLAGYDARWNSDEWETISAEQTFGAPLRHPETGAVSQVYRVGGKLDVLARQRSTGLKYLFEHKTSSEDLSPGSDYWRHLAVDSQVSIYLEGAAALGHDVAGCIYDVLGKPDLRPYRATPVESRKYKRTGELYANQREQDETPDEYQARVMDALATDPNRYFARSEIVRLEAERRAAGADLWQFAEIIHQNSFAGRAPRNTDACLRFNRPCEFFAVCAGEASLDDPTLFRRDSNIHPELAGS